MKFLIVLLLLSSHSSASDEKNFLFDPDTSVLLCLHSLLKGEDVFRVKKLEWEDWQKDQPILYQDWENKIRGIYLTQELDFGRDNVKVVLNTYRSTEGMWSVEAEGFPLRLSDEERKIRAHFKYLENEGWPNHGREPKGLRSLRASHVLTGTKRKGYCVLGGEYCDYVLLAPKSLTVPEQLAYCADNGPKAKP